MTRRTPNRFIGVAGLGWALLATGSAGAQPQAVLALDVSEPAVRGARVTVPLAFAYEDATINALVFSIDLDTGRLTLDPADDNMDGVPDAVKLPAGMPSITYIGYDPDDTGGEIDVMLANLSGAPLPQGVILIFQLTPVRMGFISSWIGFSDDPPASFGEAQGQTVAGTTLVIGSEIFADGFESGDTSAWQNAGPSGGLP